MDELIGVNRMDKTLLYTIMLSTVNAYEPSELISPIVGTVLLTWLLTFVVLEVYNRAKTVGQEDQ